MAERPNLDDERGGKLIDPTHFRRMVGSLMYLSTSRPDIVFAVCCQDTRRKVEEMFERIISKGRRLEDLIQKKLDDLKDNHKFRGGLLGINLHKT
ncbi:hypothetical protein Tco_1191157 [Tanacetum coccineum]